jgi:hypothetical protein
MESVMVTNLFRRSAYLITLLLGFCLSGCVRGPDPRIPAAYGLGETVVGTPIAEQAILFANVTLPPDQRLRLQPTWTPVGYFPTQTFKTDTHQPGFRVARVTDLGFENEVIFTNADAIPVFLIEGQSLGNVEVAFVPDGCRCIFVNAHSLDDLSRRLYLVGPDAIEQHGDFDKSIALSLVFLHELGHIRFGDRGSYASNARLELAEINKPSQAISNPEVRADAFASEVVRLAWSSGEMQSPFYEPYGRADIASNIFRVMETGFNSYDLVHDPQGILDKKVKYELFWQNGYSHLNLYLRLLIFLQQSEPTEERYRYLELIKRASADMGMTK